MSNAEELKGIRYFRVNNNTQLDGVPLKKGDIVRLQNEDITDIYTLSTLFTLPLFRYIKMSTIIGEYPEEQPLTYKLLIDFLKEKKINVGSYPSPIVLDFGYDGIYLTDDLARRIFKDSYHDVELDINAGRFGAEKLFPGIPEKLAIDKFKEAMSQTDDLSFPMELGDYNRMLLYEAGGITKYRELLDGAMPKEGNCYDIQQLDYENIKPGIYSTDKPSSVMFYFDSEQEIDFGKQPEYLYNFINIGFLEFLNSSTEVLDKEEKKQIYDSINQDAIIVRDSDGSPISKIRYYRVRPGIVINADEQHMFEKGSLLKEYLSIDGCDELDTSRIIGEMRVVEKNSNDEAEIIKVIIDDGTEANHAYNTDGELNKLGERLSRLDLHMVRLKEITRYKKEELQALRKRYGAKSSSSNNEKKDIYSMDPIDRRIKLIDIAAYRVKKTKLSDDFKQKAEEYYRKNTEDSKGHYSRSKTLKMFDEVYSCVAGEVCLEEGDGLFYYRNDQEKELFKYTFYMVHLIEREFPNPILAEAHSKLQNDARKNFTNTLGQILTNRTDGDSR